MAAKMATTIGSAASRSAPALRREPAPERRRRPAARRGSDLWAHLCAVAERR